MPLIDLVDMNRRSGAGTSMSGDRGAWTCGLKFGSKIWGKVTK